MFDLLMFLNIFDIISTFTVELKVYFLLFYQYNNNKMVVQYETFDRADWPRPICCARNLFFRFSFITNMYYSIFFIQSFVFNISDSFKYRPTSLLLPSPLRVYHYNVVPPWTPKKSQGTIFIDEKTSGR